MIHKIVSVYDNKAEAFLKPVFVQSNGEAIRSFQDAVNDSSTQFSKHPSDYSMWSIGEWNDSTATFTPNTNGNIELAKALALLDKSA